MTKGLKLFFDDFDKLADSSGGVQKLRELILQLAIQGKLVPQNPNDESASELLNKIKAEKEKLIKDGKIKKQKPLPPIEPDEAPHKLPKGWEWVKLGQIQEFVNGYTFKSSEYEDEGTGIVRIGDIQNSCISTTNMKYIRTSIEKELNEKQKVYPGDMVIAMSGATAGKLGFNNTDQIFLLNQRVGKLVIFQVKPVYIYHYLTTKIQENLSISAGSAIPNLSTSQINNIILPLPPLAEQKRIVAKVEELMALCNQLEAQQEKARHGRIILNNSAIDYLLTAGTTKDFDRIWQLICDNFDLLYDNSENVNKLRQTILQLAVQGKLVPQNPNDESASELLKKIKTEKEKLIKEGKLKKQKPLPPIKPEEINLDLPKNWTWCRLGEIVETTQGIQISKSEQITTAQSGYKRYLYISDFRNEKAMKYVKDIYPHKIVKKQDLIVVNTGATSGEIFKGIDGILSNNLFKVSFEEDYIFSDYLYRFVKSPMFKMWQSKLAKGGANPHMGHKNFNSTPMALPPFAEQQRIVKKVDELMALCEDLKEKIKQSKEKSEKLMNATIHHLLVA